MKRTATAATLLTLSALALAGCSNAGNIKSESADPASGQSPAGEAGATIEFWSAWTEGADTEAGSLAMIQKFEEQTGCTVNQTNFTYDMLREKIISSAAGGNLPDVIWGLPEYVGEFYKLGILNDVSSAWDEWEDKDKVSAAVKDAMTIDGKIIGFPYETTTRAYLVHDDLFKEAGAEVPSTWEEVLALGNKIEEATGSSAFGIAGAGVRAPQELVVFLAQNGVEIATEQPGGGFKNTWLDNPAELKQAAEVFHFYQELISSGAANPNSASYGWEETDENLATGLTASYVSGNWLGEREESNPETMGDISIRPIPKPAGGVDATYLEAKPMMVLAKGESLDCATQFARANASEEWQKAAFIDRSALSTVSGDTKWSTDFQALQKDGITFPPVALSGVTQAMIDSLAMALQDNASPEDTAKFLSEEINASLESSGDLAAK